MTLVRLLSAVALLLSLAGCGADEDTDDPNAPVDVYPEDVPVLAEGAIEYQFPVSVVEAGTEVQQCYFLPRLEEDIYVTALDSYQAAGGHHLVLFKSIVPEPEGSLRDCTGISDMITLIPVVSSVNFGLEHFPEGMAVRVKAGTQLVFQQHYVNTLDRTVRTHDVSHLQTIPQEDVEVFAGFYGLANIDFSLAPVAGDLKRVEFSCAVPKDLNVLLVGPHMHEFGRRFQVDIGPADDMQSIFDIDPWEPWMRDAPPAQQFPMEDPLVVHEGDLIRTRCTFDNDSGRELSFPSEMCATYGYYYPAPEGSEEWLCSGDDGRVDDVADGDGGEG